MPNGDGPCQISHRFGHPLIRSPHGWRVLWPRSTMCWCLELKSLWTWICPFKSVCLHTSVGQSILCQAAKASDDHIIIIRALTAWFVCLDLCRFVASSCTPLVVCHVPRVLTYNSCLIHVTLNKFAVWNGKWPDLPPSMHQLVNLLRVVSSRGIWQGTPWPSTSRLRFIDWCLAIQETPWSARSSWHMMSYTILSCSYRSGAILSL